MSAFSNYCPAPMSVEERRARFAELRAEIQRQIDLPAGHPEVLRAFEGRPDPLPIDLVQCGYCNGILHDRDFALHSRKCPRTPAP